MKMDIFILEFENVYDQIIMIILCDDLILIEFCEENFLEMDNEVLEKGFNRLNNFMIFIKDLENIKQEFDCMDSGFFIEDIEIYFLCLDDVIIMKSIFMLFIEVILEIFCQNLDIFVYCVKK